MMPVIRITESAARHLKKRLASRAVNPNQRLRLVAAPGAQVGLVLDQARETDEIIEVDGSPILLIEAALVPILKGATLDCSNTPEGAPVDSGEVAEGLLGKGGNEGYNRELLFAFFCLADVCIVSSLEAGMDLVANEFIPACHDGSRNSVPAILPRCC